MPKVIAYTDGGCRGNPGIGAWAFVLIHPTSRRTLERAQAVIETTNQRMELSAAIEALGAMQRPSQVVLYSDSKYVIHCATRWMEGWKQRGWKRKGGELKNIDLLQKLDLALTPHQIDWRWVPGHSGNPGNERVDLLANEAMDRLAAHGEARFERRGTWQHAL